MTSGLVILRFCRDASADKGTRKEGIHSSSSPNSTALPSFLSRIVWPKGAWTSSPECNLGRITVASPKGYSNSSSEYFLPTLPLLAHGELLYVQCFSPPFLTPFLADVDVFCRASLKGGLMPPRCSRVDVNRHLLTRGISNQTK